MPAGILPRGGWGAIKPPLGTPIEFGTSLTDGLIRLWSFAEGGGRSIFDSCRTGFGLRSADAWSGHKRGPALSHTSTGDTVDFGSSDFLPTSNCTIVLGYRKRDATARAATAFGVAISGNGARAGVHLPYSDGTTYFDWGGLTEGTTRLSVAGLTFGDDLWAFTTGSRGMEIWQNGILMASNAANPTRTSEPASNWFLGKGQFVDASDLADYWYLSVYDRQMIPQEIQALAVDPYQMFAPPAWRRYFMVSAPAVTPASFPPLRPSFSHLIGR